MELATPQVHQTGANSYDVSHGNDKGLYVEFESIPHQNKFKSEQEGRPIFEDKDYIKIMIPGDKTKVVHSPVREEHKLRFPRQWEAYQKMGKVEHSGTPIEQWPPLTKSEVAELKALNIFTIESLASLPDVAMTWLGARDLSAKAKLWMENAKGGAVVTALQSDNANLKLQVEDLQRQIKELASLKKDNK